VTDVRRVLPALAFVVIASTASVAGCAADGPPTPTDPVLATGQQVYDRNCASCHGRSGGGGVGPALGNIEKTYPNVDAHTAIVAKGVRGTNMPAFEDRLTPEEIDAVVRYERESL